MSYDALILSQVAQSYALLGTMTASLSHTTNGPEDPATGIPTTTAIQTCSTRCKLDSTSIKTLGFKFGDGLVQSGDIEATVPGKGLAFAPQPGDILSAGFPYVIISVRPSFAPGGAVAEYNLLVRK